MISCDYPQVTLLEAPKQQVDLKVPALTFGDVATMYKGLAALVSLPASAASAHPSHTSTLTLPSVHPRLVFSLFALPQVGSCAVQEEMDEAVRDEHCDAPDSHAVFCTGNYSVRTTSATEYWFVADPTRPAADGDLLKSEGGDSWPVEGRLRDDPTQRHLCRVAKPPRDFDKARKALDAQLAPLGLSPIRDVEFLCARLYTGPLFEK